MKMLKKVLFLFFVIILIEDSQTINQGTSLNNISWEAIFRNCTVPPLVCPNENVTFWLYTKKTKNTPYQLVPDNVESLASAPWVKDAPIKILIHGYNGHRDSSFNTEIRPAYLNSYNYNIISVDYLTITRIPCYEHAVTSTELIGKCTAHLIDTLVKDHGLALAKFHVIGFTFGAQSAGYVGSYLQSGQLERITGVQPAMPLFRTSNTSRKLDPSDAKFVDVLHTYAIDNTREAMGHIDFFANAGLKQPGCPEGNERKYVCDQMRAPLYYAESISTTTGFYGTRCDSVKACMEGSGIGTGTDEEVLFGEHVPIGSKGLYFFRTNSKSPYARGSNKNKGSTTA